MLAASLGVPRVRARPFLMGGVDSTPLGKLIAAVIASVAALLPASGALAAQAARGRAGGSGGGVSSRGSRSADRVDRRGTAGAKRPGLPVRSCAGARRQLVASRSRLHRVGQMRDRPAHSERRAHRVPAWPEPRKRALRASLPALTETFGLLMRVGSRPSGGSRRPARSLSSRTDSTAVASRSRSPPERGAISGSPTRVAPQRSAGSRPPAGSPSSQRACRAQACRSGSPRAPKTASGSPTIAAARSPAAARSAR